MALAGNVSIKHIYKQNHEFKTLLCWVRIVKSYSHLSCKQEGWNKWVSWAEFFCLFKWKSKLHYIKNASRGAKTQKSISKDARL